MRILLDTNVLVRLADRASSHHAVAKAATLKLESDGQQLCLGLTHLLTFNGRHFAPFSGIMVVIRFG